MQNGYTYFQTQSSVLCFLRVQWHSQVSYGLVNCFDGNGNRRERTLPLLEDTLLEVSPVPSNICCNSTWTPPNLPFHQAWPCDSKQSVVKRKTVTWWGIHLIHFYSLYRTNTFPNSCWTLTFSRQITQNASTIFYA